MQTKCVCLRCEVVSTIVNLYLGQSATSASRNVEMKQGNLPKKNAVAVLRNIAWGLVTSLLALRGNF